ncbi:hypothetical protein BS333_09650 [Vibrio azureus]|uniref:Uncharacterized protein n=1 Tax=Vibrio azureus NBRC 104587 TaxID=1219077 RepID=U3AP34_9VIBR|nr:hypothetical protein BS333_09650 [Vibrio azureus]GAD75057.1 hypothetical protein VAZ01S_018_00330 [Vibrio azureus NBRC 104587]
MEDLFSQFFRLIAKEINSEHYRKIKTYLPATVDKKLVVPILADFKLPTNVWLYRVKLASFWMKFTHLVQTIRQK